MYKYFFLQTQNFKNISDRLFTKLETSKNRRLLDNKQSQRNLILNTLITLLSFLLVKLNFLYNKVIKFNLFKKLSPQRKIQIRRTQKKRRSALA
jgi:hypothetical protein